MNTHLLSLQAYALSKIGFICIIKEFVITYSLNLLDGIRQLDIRK